MLNTLRSWANRNRLNPLHRWWLTPINKIYLKYQERLQRLSINAASRLVVKAQSMTRPSEWLTVANQAPFGIIKPLQVEVEIIGLLEMLSEKQPATVVEIGTANGGTLFTFCRAASKHAKIISIDLPGGDFGGGYPVWKSQLFESFAGPNQELQLWRCNSHARNTLERLEAELGGRKIDFLFIDGDHTYEGARGDFESYSRLVAPGGLIGFHDIKRHPNGRGGEVYRLWAEIAKRYRVHEFVSEAQLGFGIGVLEWAVDVEVARPQN